MNYVSSAASGFIEASRGVRRSPLNLPSLAPAQLNPGENGTFNFAANKPAEMKKNHFEFTLNASNNKIIIFIGESLRGRLSGRAARMGGRLIRLFRQIQCVVMNLIVPLGGRSSRFYLDLQQIGVRARDAINSKHARPLQ